MMAKTMIVTSQSSSWTSAVSTLSQGPGAGERAPKIARPTRTIVAPSTSASSRSAVIPIDRSVNWLVWQARARNASAEFPQP